MQVRFIVGSIAATLVAIATATPAHACPEGALCVDLSQSQTIREEVPLAPTPRVLPPLSVVVAQLELDDAASSPSYRPLPDAVDRSSFDALWNAARDGVYRHLPTLHVDEYALRLSPIVVATSFAKIPGIGFSGEY